MTARDKFTLGDEVKFTEYWISLNNAWRPLSAQQKIRERRGRVVGFGKKSTLCVWIIMNDRKGRETYHMDFLEVTPK